MTRRGLTRLPGFRAWTYGRHGLALSLAALAVSQVLLWTWRWEMLAPALISGPLPQSLAAWTSLALLGLALLGDRNAVPGRDAPGTGSWRHLTRDPMIRVSLVASCGYLVMALLAPALMPQDPNRIGDGAATQNLPPGAAVHLLLRRQGGTIAANAVDLQGDTVRFRRGGSWSSLPRADLRGTLPDDWHRVRYHWLGTDHLGRDLLSRMLAAAPVSLGIGMTAALLAVLLGALVGGVAGMAGRRMDALLMRITDMFLAFPRLFLVLLVLAVIPGSLAAATLVLAATGWMAPARLVRAQILSLREEPFVHAARAAGRGRTGILVRHLLPHAAAPLLVAASLRIGETMLVEAGLSYLGLGVPLPHASWGNIIAGARPALAQAWWVAAFPGMMLTGAVLSFNLLGDGLRRVMARR